MRVPAQLADLRVKFGRLTRSHRWTPADRLTVTRMAAAPALIVAAATGSTALFVCLAALGLVTDAADGAVARALRCTSPRGAQLDSRADIAFYCAMLAGLVLLFPARIVTERTMLLLVLGGYVVPILIGWLKFRRLTSYHTTLARVSIVLLSLAVSVWLWLNTVLPLRLAVAVFMLSAIEELVITITLTRPRENIAHVFQLYRVTQPTRKPC